MNVLICDDSPEEASGLAGLLADSGFPIHTTVFHNGHDALDYLRTGASADLCFLDIVMPGMNGIALARALRDGGFTGEIVFLTASRDYGHESYRVNAFDYLLKPPALADIRDVLRRWKQAREREDTEGVLVKTSGMARFVLFREISHVEVITHTLYYRLTDGGVVAERGTFAEAAARLLCDPRFIQCHRSYIVNMDDIQAVSGRNFTMRSGQNIPLSKSYPEAKKNYLQWVAFGRKEA